MLKKVFILLLIFTIVWAQDDSVIDPMSDITIRRVVITPANPEVYPGETIHFRFQAFTAENKEVPAAFTWRFSGGKLHHDGRFIAGDQPGKHIMEAEAPNGVKGIATITIKTIHTVDNTPVTLKISPNKIHLQPGQKCKFTFGAYNRSGKKVPVPLQISFGGGNLDTQGNFIAGNKHGKYKFVISTEKGLSAEAKVFIGDVATSDQQPVYIKVTPARISLFPGEKTKFVFAAYDKFGEKVDGNLSIAYSGGKIDSFGNFIAGDIPGRYEFKVTSGSIEGIAKIHVLKKENHHTQENTSPKVEVTTDNKINLLLITPKFAVLRPGEQQKFDIKAYNKNGQPVTPQASIQFGGGKFTPQGIYTAGQRPGKYEIVLVSPEGKKAVAKIEIVNDNYVSPTKEKPGPLAKIILEPRRKRIHPAQKMQFSFKALDKNGNQAVTPLSWSFQGGLLTAEGVYTSGYGYGQHYVTLTGANGVEATSIVAIVPQNDEYIPPVWIELQPRKITLAPGQSCKISCIVTNDQGYSVGTSKIKWEFLGGNWDEENMKFTAGSRTGDFYLRARYDNSEYVVARIHVDIR